MMHKAWRGTEEVRYCFFEVISQILRSHGPPKMADLDPIWAFVDDDCNLNAFRKREAVLYFFSDVIIQISMLHGPKNGWFGSDLSVSLW